MTLSIFWQDDTHRTLSFVRQTTVYTKPQSDAQPELVIHFEAVTGDFTPMYLPLSDIRTIVVNP